jgi:hypothetical protein
MSEIKIRQATDACSAAGPRFSLANEPSHIHIPRPSRVRQSATLARKELEATALPRILADEAA